MCDKQENILYALKVAHKKLKLTISSSAKKFNKALISKKLQLLTYFRLDIVLTFIIKME